MATPVNFQESTDSLSPAAGDEDRVAPLPILRERAGEGFLLHSLWQLTPAELQRIAQEGCVLLTVIGQHPPVAMSVPPLGTFTPIQGDPIQEDEEYSVLEA